MWENLLSKMGMFTRKDRDILLNDIQGTIKDLTKTIQEKHNQQNKGITYLDEHVSKNMNQICDIFCSVEKKLDQNAVELEHIRGQVEQSSSMLNVASREIYEVVRATQKQQAEIHDSICNITRTLDIQMKIVTDINQTAIRNGGISEKQFYFIMQQQDVFLKQVKSVENQLEQIPKQKDIQNMEELLRLLILNRFADDAEKKIKS